VGVVNKQFTSTSFPQWRPRRSMETTSHTQPAEVARVAVRLPPFWAEQPDVWFAQAEAQFSPAGITNEQKKFHHVIAQLGHRYAAEVRDIITSQPQQDPYTKLRTELLDRCPPPESSAFASSSRPRQWGTVSRPST
jgi:hypothetical protein